MTQTLEAEAEETIIRSDVRNVAIVAHVDHGKTTLVDQMLRQSGLFRSEELDKLKGGQHGLIFDSNDQERERGITILAKNCALQYGDYKINLIDTPGHADFGGEVERTLGMADGCLLLVDAAEGPLPQTRFVLKKAFDAGLKPIVVVNKVDRPDARPTEVLNMVYDLFIAVGADDDMLDFPFLYASGRDGWATDKLGEKGETIKPIFDLIIDKVPGPTVKPTAPLQMLVSNIEWSDYVGRIAVGRIYSGSVKRGERVTLMKRDKNVVDQVEKLLVFDKLGKREVEQVSAGEVAAIIGLDEVEIGDTIAALDAPVALARLSVDEPTLTMLFTINDSPMAGRDGQYVTSRNLRDRLIRELDSNVALRVADGESKDEFLVSGRGLLHLGVLIETMRREGYELSVGKPQVIMKEIDGQKCEPIELLVVDVPSDKVGAAMELVGSRKGELKKMDQLGNRTTIEFVIPARGLIGMRTRLLNVSQGEGIMHHVFHGYEPFRGEIPHRLNGVMISNISGKAVPYTLFSLQDRGTMFVDPGDEIYEGMVVAEHCRDSDMVVNPCREKKLTNIRAAGSDDNIILKPARKMELERALEYIEDDEL
ncbi:MAG: translational GTPase TypA, partial [Planctomycetia bacterium]